MTRCCLVLHTLSVLLVLFAVGCSTPDAASKSDPKPDEQSMTATESPDQKAKFDAFVAEFLKARFESDGRDITVYTKFGAATDRDSKPPVFDVFRKGFIDRRSYFNATSYRVLRSGLSNSNKGFVEVEYSYPTGDMARMTPSMSKPQQEAPPTVEAPRLVLNLRYEFLRVDGQWHVLLYYKEAHELMELRRNQPLSRQLDGYQGPEGPIFIEALREPYERDRYGWIQSVMMVEHFIGIRDYEYAYTFAKSMTAAASAPEFVKERVERIKTEEAQWNKVLQQTGLRAELLKVEPMEDNKHQALVRVTNGSNQDHMGVIISAKGLPFMLGNKSKPRGWSVTVTLAAGESKEIKLTRITSDLKAQDVRIAGFKGEPSTQDALFAEYIHKLHNWALSEVGRADGAHLVRQVLFNGMRAEQACPDWTERVDIDVTFDADGRPTSLSIDGGNVSADTRACLQKKLMTVQVLPPGIERRLKIPLYPDFKLR